ncbi:hypothetical protein RhiirC2_801121 [Rhizophagus irregularis]|uniref:Uncharacterized protein n=1 Tax=Rhizophagus irregularis TaxID=588596 RepID=A0A2N1M2T1_9GLOM|nr:hypothetical protein RhiirC2_801121 [Rhizophagus irregularis]
MEENRTAQPDLNIKVPRKLVRDIGISPRASCRQEFEGGSHFQQSIAVNSATKESGKGFKGVAERNLSR